MNHATKRSARTTPTLCLVLVAGAVLTGCTADEPLPPAERPEVVWSEGGPEGPLEGDPWVQAVRASEVELSTAAYTRDFSTHELARTTGGSEIARVYRGVGERAEKSQWEFPLGPRPMIPIGVVERAGSQSRAVYMCVAKDFSVSADEPERNDSLLGWIDKYVVEMKDGEYFVSQVGGSNPEGAEIVLGEDVVEPFLDDREDSDCSLDDAKVGLFDPPPDVTVEYGPEDIKVTDSAG